MELPGSAARPACPAPSQHACEVGKRVYLVVFAMPVHHPVFAISTDFQLVGFDIIAILGLPGNRPLRGNGREQGEKAQVHLRKRGGDVRGL